ncbi:heme oxygenase (plasmid) [Deinococcus metallilatus]|uniref:Biliverdin-producing heme oxygenase n=2 Tax=Deinococcus metallilatus TaxID=1211322 RepID=A0AAJ5F7S1_9DEIO|nr:heme oxygenase [Deinococcus metallilatus]RXJ18132.1 heme oxygenase [Deinococcus metallilatus]TLK32068.1 biliverdin-producing heme oxygenase [Deinococcus metallilatus]GMA15430.1 heme oxygenase [Deinococcus metallilatus]
MLMSRLKQATQRQHQEVEALMPVMQPSLSREAYARLLRQLHAVVGPLEAQLLTLPLPAPFEIDLRLKEPLLLRDLAALPDTPPVRPASPHLAGVPEALGALYVLEGATLGGQVITRHLRRTLGLTPESGSAYFHGYGPATGRMWQAFGEALDGQVALDDEARVIGGAQKTFQAFGDALCGVPA